jgi:penicillin-insensitive murein endopeptidase
MRRQRRRFFGHPMLIRFLQELGAAAAQQRLGVLSIGDLGQPRGGPTPTGHRSHQTGLDVDIWFWILSDGTALTPMERDTMEAPSMLTADGQALDDRQWSSRQADVLRLATGFDVVARIFVNPVIKKGLCTHFPHAPWLQKLRPWWGHDHHFHVRLRCPPGEASCKDQEPLPIGDGCGAELDWWFSDEARQPPPYVPPTKVVLPAACEQLLRR